MTSYRSLDPIVRKTVRQNLSTIFLFACHKSTCKIWNLW